jgi:molybdenum-dependent DNA-binding transcriptional regulator ModE
MHLTPTGRRLLDLFDRLEEEIGARLLQASAELRAGLEGAVR